MIRVVDDDDDDDDDDENLYLTTICFKANTCLRGRVYV